MTAGAHLAARSRTALTATDPCADICINNAGQGCVAPLIEVEAAAVRQTFDVNVFGLLTMTQAVAPHMVEKRSGTSTLALRAEREVLEVLSSSHPQSSTSARSWLGRRRRGPGSTALPRRASKASRTCSEWSSKVRLVSITMYCLAELTLKLFRLWRQRRVRRARRDQKRHWGLQRQAHHPQTRLALRLRRELHQVPWVVVAE